MAAADSVLFGTAGDDTLEGSDGSDWIEGAGGNDSLSGLDGDDTLLGASGADSLLGGAGDDFLQAGGDSNFLDGGEGIDTVSYEDFETGVRVGLGYVYASGDALDGERELLERARWETDTIRGIEAVRGSDYDDLLSGGDTSGSTVNFQSYLGHAGNDTILGLGGYDRADYTTSTSGVTVALGGITSDDPSAGMAFDGLGGTDRLYEIDAVRGSDHADLLSGTSTAPYESFEGGGGNDTINGMGFVDRADYIGDAGAVSVDLGLGRALDGSGSTDLLMNIDDVRGSAFGDTLTGNSSQNSLDGDAGDDLLRGGAGSDTLRGGTGDDTLDGGSEATVRNGDFGFSAGIDQISYDDATSGVTVAFGADGTAGSASGGGFGQDLLTGIEHVIGSAYADTIRGSDRATVEVISGGLGNDMLFGGSGTGTDLGVNYVDYRSSPGSVTVDLLAGVAVGLTGSDSLTGFNGVIGSSHDDQLTGDAQNNYLDGGGGRDTIDGGAGFDIVSFESRGSWVQAGLQPLHWTGSYGDGANLANIEGLSGTVDDDILWGNAAGNALYGCAGNDSLSGEAGDDTLYGGHGDDRLDGGDGSDTYVYDAAGNGIDYIQAFRGGDTIRIRASLQSIVSYSSGAPVAAGTAQLKSGLEGTFLLVDTDGAAGHDLSIQLGAYAYDYAPTLSSLRLADLGDGESHITLVANASGTLRIRGAPAQGQILEVRDDVQEPDGYPSNWWYEWLLDGEMVASGSSLTLTQAHVGKSISVRKAYVDLAGVSESVTSEPTIITNVNDTPAGLAIITGSTAAGGTLTASHALSDADGLGAMTYRWFVEGAPMAAGASFVLPAAAIGKSIHVEATYTDGYGTVERVRSANLVTLGDANDSHLVGAGAQWVVGGAGEDTISGTNGGDTIDGGSDDDTVEYRSWTSSYYRVTTTDDATVVDNLGWLGAGVDTLKNVEYIRFADKTLVVDHPGETRSGGSGGDVLVATGRDDVLSANAGNDYIYARDGRDWLDGGDGIDVLLGEEGSDTMMGAGGNDYLFGGSGSDWLYGGDGVDVFIAGPGSDMLFGDGGVDYFYGEDGDDRAYGGDSTDILVGGVGSDFFEGQAGNDYAYAGDGADTLLGGAGVDVLLGEAGDDVFDGGDATVGDVDYLFLGTGVNTVRVRSTSSVQVIFDLAADALRDRIDLSATPLRSFQAVSAAATDMGSYTILTVDADTCLWLIGITRSSLGGVDFLF